MTGWLRVSSIILAWDLDLTTNFGIMKYQQKIFRCRTGELLFL